MPSTSVHIKWFTSAPWLEVPRIDMIEQAVPCRHVDHPRPLLGRFALLLNVAISSIPDQFDSEGNAPRAGAVLRFNQPETLEFTQAHRHDQRGPKATWGHSCVQRVEPAPPTLRR
jgi:hypothetical protein